MEYKDQLLSQLMTMGLLNKQQHGFISKHSTVTNLLESTQDWSLSFHSKQPVDVIYILTSAGHSTVWYTLN